MIENESENAVDASIYIHLDNRTRNHKGLGIVRLQIDQISGLLIIPIGCLLVLSQYFFAYMIIAFGALGFITPIAIIALIWLRWKTKDENKRFESQYKINPNS